MIQRQGTGALLCLGRLASTVSRLVSSSTAATLRGPRETPGALRDPVRQVFISQSSDVFTNLALEDWLYRHHDFEHKHLLLLWRNNPCVVIGRHQNPWTEADVPYLRSSDVHLARRHSGGGTVYHDLGNINCTFFTRKSNYHRRRNLDVICAAIKRTTALDVSVNDREDIVLNDKHKISGTAAKLGKDNAYHHCTVLVDVNECKLHDALNSKASNVESRATQSVRVPVRNLRAVDPSIDPEALQESLGWQFLRTSVDGCDGGMDAARKQRGFQMVRPDEGWFPGIDELREELASHQWIFGKTPRFKVRQTFEVPSEMFPDPTYPLGQVQQLPEFTLELEVNHGMIDSVQVQSPGGFMEDTSSSLSETLHGLKFGPDLPEAVTQALKKEANMNVADFVGKCVVQMVRKFA